MADNPWDSSSIFDDIQVKKITPERDEPSYNLTAFGTAIAMYTSAIALAAIRPDASEAINNVLLSIGLGAGVFYSGRKWEQSRWDRQWLTAEEKLSKNIINLAERVAEWRNELENKKK